MKTPTNDTLRKIFTNPAPDFNGDWNNSIFIINDLVDDAIKNINSYPELGPEYAESNPEMLIGYVRALSSHYNSHHLIQTIQEGFAAIVEELRKNRENADND
ncbi:MAG: hypothetical protein ACD_74C00138G0005 [uncultured bacterium]|nr:MAG: hypothetical protein ACD_74C00138G0005 [uncultured bacterium]